MAHHIYLWIRFIIAVPLVFFLGKLASNFAFGINEFSSIIVYAIFLWSAGYVAYFCVPYKLGGLAFLYLYVWGSRTIFGAFIKGDLDMLMSMTLNPFVFIGMVAVLCFIGLWGAYRNGEHYSTEEGYR